MPTPTSWGNKSVFDKIGSSREWGSNKYWADFLFINGRWIDFATNAHWKDFPQN